MRQRTQLSITISLASLFFVLVSACQKTEIDTTITAYTNFTSSFAGSQFIWSSNLNLDNLVLLRFTGK